MSSAIETKAYWYLESESKLEEFLRGWIDGSLPKAEWTHAAHVAGAACVVCGSTAEAALPVLRERIRRYNEAVGGQNTEDAGYHETLTKFWTLVVASVAAEGESRLGAARKAVAQFGGARDLYKSFYEHDVVRDRQARREWVAPAKSAEFAALCQSGVVGGVGRA